MKKTAFITGATSGIGKATAELFATKGHPFNNLWTKKRTFKRIEKAVRTFN